MAQKQSKLAHVRTIYEARSVRLLRVRKTQQELEIRLAEARAQREE